MIERRAQPRQGGEALAKMGQAVRLLRLAAVVLGVYLAAAVTVASVVGVVNSFRAVEFAREARDQARTNGDVAQLIRDCVEPTPEGEEPTECVRYGDERTGRAVAAIVDVDGNGVLDGVEIRQALQRIERAIGSER